MTVGFITIHGQTKLPQTKQNQIEYLVKEYNVDILHMQETQIDESAFENNPFIANNFNIIFNNSETARLLPHQQKVLHEGCNPSSIRKNHRFQHRRPHHDQHLSICGQTIPNMMLAAKKKGMIGGDFNCITHPSDCTHHPEPKMSPNLKKTSTILKWRDTFVHLQKWILNLHTTKLPSVGLGRSSQRRTAPQHS